MFMLGKYARSAKISPSREYPWGMATSDTKTAATLALVAVLALGASVRWCWTGLHAQELSEDRARAVLEVETSPTARRAALARVHGSILALLTDLRRLRDAADPELREQIMAALKSIAAEASK